MAKGLCVVFSHKTAWRRADGQIETDGGFPMHMAALSSIFDQTYVVLPVNPSKQDGGKLLEGNNLRVVPIKKLPSNLKIRRLLTPLWILWYLPKFVRLIWKANVVHVPIPSDIGTIGMMLAFWMKKPLYVRHCGNWFREQTKAEKFWKSFMIKSAGGRNVFLTTGYESEPPSVANPNIEWIFSSSLTKIQLKELSLQHTSFSSSQSLRLVTAGRQEKEKGADKCLHTVAWLKSNGGSVHLDVLGDGGYLPKLKQLALDLGLGEADVTFHGKVEHAKVISTMQKGHIFLFPTTSSEGFPKVVLEAMACGLTVIANPVSAIRKLLEGGAGISLESDDPDNIGKLIQHLYQNPDQLANYKELSVSKAQEYSLEAWAEFIDNRIKSILK